MCKCNPEIRTPFCGKIGCGDPYCESRELDDVLDDWVDVGTRAKRVLAELYPDDKK